MLSGARPRAVPGLALLVVGFSQGQKGGCSLFAAATANAAAAPRAPLAVEACDTSGPRMLFLLGVTGLVAGTAAGVYAVRRRDD